MFHKINHILPQIDRKLTVQFSEGVTKIYDIRKLYDKIPAFKILDESDELYNSVEVDTGGYGIVWDDDLDLSCDELWENGVVIETPFDNLIALNEATIIWGLSESTLRKAISYGKLIAGIDVCKFGKQWVVSRDAMIREYGSR